MEKIISKRILFTGDICTQIFPQIRSLASVSCFLALLQCYTCFVAGTKPVPRIYCTKSYLLRHMQCFCYERNRSNVTFNIDFDNEKQDLLVFGTLTLCDVVAMPLLCTVELCLPWFGKHTLFLAQSHISPFTCLYIVIQMTKIYGLICFLNEKSFS